MTVGLAFAIAIRHLGARKRQSALATLGVAVGGGVFALMLAIANGQSDFLRERLIEFSPHITVRSLKVNPTVARSLVTPSKGGVLELRTNVPPAERREVKPYDEVMARLEALAPDVTAVAPFVSLPAALRNARHSATVDVRGVVPSRERRIGRWVETIRDGSLDSMERMPSGIVIGRGLARTLNAGVGSTLAFVGPNGRVERVVVAAVFESAISTLDDGRVFVNMPFAQAIRGMQRNAATGISVETSDITRAYAIRDRVQDMTGFVAETWEETNAQRISFQARQNTTTEVLVMLVFATGAFGVANVLTAVVLQKRRDIAIMKSYGVSRVGLVSVFLIEGGIIGLVGGVLAAVSGYLGAMAFGSMNLFPQSSAGSYLRFEQFPVSLDPSIYLATIVVSALMSLAASAFPAGRAARCSPVDNIRSCM